MLTVLDVETKTAFDNLKRKKPEDLGVSFTGVMTLEAGKKKYLGFWEDELSLLWPLLEQSDLVVGFNLFDFDYPALSPYYSGDLASLPTLDILKEFEKTAGHRISLNSIAKATLGLEKNGTGLQAIGLFNKGRLDELKKYCLKDVEITYKVYKHIKQFGFLKYINKWNNVRQIKLDFKVDDKEAKVQMTLG
jgi:DEAD/DEAH box helicase domain-containing protein